MMKKLVLKKKEKAKAEKKNLNKRILIHKDF